MLRRTSPTGHAPILNLFGTAGEGAERASAHFRENINLTTRIILTVATVVAILGMMFPALDIVRPIAALLFFCVVPGAAVVHNMRPLTTNATWALALAISLAANCALAVIAVWLHVFHPLPMLIVFGVACVSALWR